MARAQHVPVIHTDGVYMWRDLFVYGRAWTSHLTVQVNAGLCGTKTMLLSVGRSVHDLIPGHRSCTPLREQIKKVWLVRVSSAAGEAALLLVMHFVAICS